ncbi:MAG: hypothetical protein RL682_1545, partial [Pseudomonadota bacterium]
MSRVGKMPVTIPAGVEFGIKENIISIKGAGGTLSLAQHASVSIQNDTGKISFIPVNDSREA